MESTLSRQFANVQSRMAVFAGWGAGALYGDQAWNASQQAVLDDATLSGLSRFYWPEMAPGHSATYDWSFLHPVATLDLPTGVNTVPLPDDFGSPEGDISILSSQLVTWPVKLFNEGQIRQAYGLNPNLSTRPQMCSLQPLKGSTPTQGQRFQLFFYPLPDQDYTIQLEYNVIPDLGGTGFPYPYGSGQHSETIIESCLAVMEERLDDMPFGTGPHGLAFIKRLNASIGIDRKLKPQTLGYNDDRSDTRFRHRARHTLDQTWAYNGVPL